MSFSALQRAEIAEITTRSKVAISNRVSVLFNEPKLLKAWDERADRVPVYVSVLFNEPKLLKGYEEFYWRYMGIWFQCSSTSRNC